MRRPTLHVFDDRVELSSEDGMLLVPVEAGAGTPKLESAALDAIIERAGARELRLVLHHPVAQVRTLRELPRLKQEDLVDLITESHDRYFRSNSAAPLVGVLKATDGRGEATVVAASTPVKPLLALESALADGGLRIRSISALGEDEEVPLETPGLRARHRLRRRVSLVGLMAVASVGWVAAGATYVVDLVGDRTAVVAERDALTGSLAQLEEIDGRIRAFEPVAEAVQRLSDPRFWISPTIQAVVEAVPPTAHLHVLTVESDGSVRVTAHGPDPLSVLDALTEAWPAPVRVVRAPEADGRSNEIVLTLESIHG